MTSKILVHVNRPTRTAILSKTDNFASEADRPAVLDPDFIDWCKTTLRGSCEAVKARMDQCGELPDDSFTKRQLWFNQGALNAKPPNPLHWFHRLVLYFEYEEDATMFRLKWSVPENEL
jgi:hypothetical protein